MPEPVVRAVTTRQSHYVGLSKRFETLNKYFVQGVESELVVTRWPVRYRVCSSAKIVSISDIAPLRNIFQHTECESLVTCERQSRPQQ